MTDNDNKPLTTEESTRTDPDYNQVDGTEACCG